MNSAIILCNSLVGVANKILKCEIPEGDLFCFQTDTTPEYLIISDCASLDVYKEIQNGENFQKTLCSATDFYPICFSIKKCNIENAEKKYIKLAELILSLKYQFSQAKEITDSYGETYLVLYN